jgi:hypothetical protein
MCIIIMKQMQVPPHSIVEAPLTGAAELLHPVVFEEGNMFCCLLGPNPQTGVIGCGKTPHAAVLDWDSRLKKHLDTAGDADEVVQYVKGIIGEKPMSDNLKAFLAVAIRPPKKRG